MTFQEIFDKACSSVIGQGKPSISDDGTCLYRGPNGLKCAVGHLISDEQMAQYGVRNNAEVYNLPLLLIDEIAGSSSSSIRLATFLSRLQWAHDESAFVAEAGCDFVSAFKDRAGQVADEYGLDKSVLGCLDVPSP